MAVLNLLPSGRNEDTKYGTFLLAGHLAGVRLAIRHCLSRAEHAEFCQMNLSETEKKIISSVVSRFVPSFEPTPRRMLVRTYEDPTAIDSLINRAFLEELDRETRSVVPRALAFEYSGNEEARIAAELSVKVVLDVLRLLFLTDPQGVEHKTIEVEAVAKTKHSVEPDIVRLGMHLVREFTDVFDTYSGTEIISFRLNERIVKIQRPEKAWDEHIRHFEKLSESGPPVAAFNLLGTEPGWPQSVTVPRKRAAKPPENYRYHPEIQRVSGDLMAQGHFRQAVLDACIQVIATLKEKAALPKKFDGDNLVNRALSPDNQRPAIRFNKLKSESDKNEQRGIWYLFRGVVGLRNSQAHVVADFDDPQRAHEYLALASLLLRLLDAATGRRPRRGAAHSG